MNFLLVVLSNVLLFANTDAATDVTPDEAIVRVVQLGMDLNLPCTSSGDEEILDFFTWSHNGVLLPDRYSRFLQSRFIIQGDYSLQIDKVAEDDEGNYTCHVLSHPPKILNYVVHVRVPAAIDGRISEETVHQVREGGDLELFCLASGRPVPSVSWFREGRVLSAEESVIDVNQSVSTLHRIVNARRKDAGRYVCEAKNGVDEAARAMFIVEVLHPPEIVVEQKWVHAGLGSMAELACSVFSQPPAQVTWLRLEAGNNPEDRQVVSFSPRIMKLTLMNGVKHVLRFHSVRDSDLGTYICRAENILGHAEGSVEMSGRATIARLYVLPSSENHIEGTNDEKDKSCYHLAWEAVSLSPIYEYKLWLKPNGYPQSNWTIIIVPSNSSALTFNAGSQHKNAYDLCDLARNVVYDVTVQSRNRFGWSNESNALLLSGEQEESSSPNHDEPTELSSPVTATTIVTTTPQSTTVLSSTTEVTAASTTTVEFTTTSVLPASETHTTAEHTIASSEFDNTDHNTETEAVTSPTVSTYLIDTTLMEENSEATFENLEVTTDSESTEASGIDDVKDSPSPVVAPDNSGISSAAIPKLTIQNAFILPTLCLLVVLSYIRI